MDSTDGIGALPRGPLTAHVATYERLITPARRPAVIDCNCVRRAEPRNCRGRSWPVCPVRRLLTVATRRCNLLFGSRSCPVHRRVAPPRKWPSS